jgi:hypothetical protein
MLLKGEGFCIFIGKRSSELRNFCCYVINAVLPEIIQSKYETDQWLPNSIELSPFSEAASHSATQEFPNILRNPKFRYHIHKSHPLVSILNQFSPVHFHITHLPPSRSCQWSLYFWLSSLKTYMQSS